MKARDNPFRTSRVLGVRYRFLQASWEELMARLRDLGYRAAVVGPEGSGKTTLLEDLEPRLAGLGFPVRWLRLNASEPRMTRRDVEQRLRASGDAGVWLVDGADLMAGGARQWLADPRRNLRGLIVATHQAGQLPTALDCRTTSELLESVVRELLGTPDADTLERLPGLFKKHRGNIRTALRELYDLSA